MSGHQYGVEQPAAPPPMPTGEYAKRYPSDSLEIRAEARTAMRRNGCKAIGFDVLAGGALLAHGYVARMQGTGIEEL